MSVADALAAGVWFKDILWDLAHGFIELKSPPNPGLTRIGEGAASRPRVRP